MRCPRCWRADLRGPGSWRFFWAMSFPGACCNLSAWVPLNADSGFEHISCWRELFRLIHSLSHPGYCPLPVCLKLLRPALKIFSPRQLVSATIPLHTSAPLQFSQFSYSQFICPLKTYLGWGAITGPSLPDWGGEGGALDLSAPEGTYSEVLKKKKKQAGVL